MQRTSVDIGHITEHEVARTAAEYIVLFTGNFTLHLPVIRIETCFNRSHMIRNLDGDRYSRQYTKDVPSGPKTWTSISIQGGCSLCPVKTRGESTDVFFH